MSPDPLSRQLTERYNRDSDAYRELWAPVLHQAGCVLVKELLPHPARRVLDLGTGAGTLLPALQATFPGARVAGLDLSPGMLALASPGFARLLGDAARLPVASESLDVVVMAFMLFHLEDPTRALLEVLRTLRPGGKLACITWAQDLDSPAGKVFTEALDGCGASPADPAAERRHEALNTPAKVKRIVQAAGFREVRAWSGDLAYVYDRETFLRWKTGVGGSKVRLLSLSPDGQSECVRRAREGLASLPPESFAFRGAVVYSVAVK